MKNIVWNIPLEEIQEAIIKCSNDRDKFLDLV